MSKTFRHGNDAVKALKRAAREEFGFEPTHNHSNKTKYTRCREKRIWTRETDFMPSRA